MKDYKFYSAKYDRAFKELFLKEKNRDLLKELLEKILDVEIFKIELKPTEKLSGNVNISQKRLDALLDTNIGKIDIEVNSEDRPYVHPRNMSYICNEYASNTLVGNKYNEETMIIQINLSYELNKKEKEIREYYVQDEDKKKFIKNFKIIEVNMEYYLNLWYDFLKKGINEDLIEENQILIMLGLELEDLEKLSNNHKKVNKYMKEIKELNENPEFRRYMTEEEDRQKIFNSEIDYARKKGLSEGKIKEKNEIAKKLLKENIDINIISSTTGLSITEIDKLLKED